MMTSSDIRKKFIEFFESKGHKILPSASLVPKDDTSVLFTSAGMQQFRRYYANPSEAPTINIATVQKCLRTSDIEEVGDSSHLTFFEMLGNFSFGYPEMKNSYYKKETIEYGWEFLTEVLGIEKNRIHATYFEDEKSGIERDEESLKVLQNIEGLKEIKAQGFKDNFWSLGTENSPGGPTAEFYVDGVEVWNLVFNQYTFQGGKYIPSKYCGVDTGMGLERLTAVMQGKDDVFETDLFWPIIERIEKISGKKYTSESHSDLPIGGEESQRDPSAMPQDDSKMFRIIADHIKAVVFLIGDGIIPSNKDKGYVARRLLRRALVYFYLINKKIDNVSNNLYPIIKSIYQNEYSELQNKQILELMNNEESQYGNVIVRGVELIGKKMDYDKFFDLYQSHGLYPELILELMARNIGYEFSKDDVDNYLREFRNRLIHHQEISKTASAGMFKGGLADAGEETIKLHTAAHLLLAALRQVLGKQVEQKGSNITAERLRFDFNNPEKLTPDQIKNIEDIVNQNIKASLPVKMEELTLDGAKKSGATGSFDDRYGDKVKIYTISDPDVKSGPPFSREICGGPHVKNTGELGHFKITKEESSSAGVRRIKAILE